MKINASALRASLEASLARHQIPGASLAVFHDGELVIAAAGVTNMTTGVELTPDTVMHIGSITKILNATLVMQLVEEGKVALDEPVTRYLPDLKLKDRQALAQITVKMLLNHTSGIDGEMLPDHGHDEETIEKGIARFAQLGQLIPPGTEFSYCNAGTVIAGYIVQRLRGKSWYRVIRERIFEPLQMEHAAALPEEALLHRASVGHYLDPDSNSKPSRTSFAFLPLSFGPCGTSLMMSARDLLRFLRVHMSDGVGENGIRLLSAHSVKVMQQLTVNNKGKGYTYADGVGIGWFLAEEGLLHHLGGGPGIISGLYAYPKHGFAAIVLTNAMHGLDLINELMEPWLAEFGTTKPFGMAETDASEKHVRIDPARYVGVYGDVISRFIVSHAAAGLMLSKQAKLACYENISTQATSPSRLIPLGDERFMLEPGGAADRASAAFRLFTFRNPDRNSRMRHLGNTLRLYSRIS
jgi:CubicO group peptidase (beta-lactamase class C family)